MGLMERATTKSPHGFFGILWRLCLAGVLTFSIAAAGSYVAVEQLVRTEEVEAPDLLTMDAAAALRRASGGGFALIIEGSEPSTHLDPGMVLAQRPGPGTTVKAGSVIRVTVASGH